jgi:hypothetical protein
MTDDYTRGLDEIRALRERLAHLEEVAQGATPQRPDGTHRAHSMLDALGDHYAAAAVPVDPKTKALQRRAYGFHPNAQLEADVATRSKNPVAWDAAQPPGMAGAGLSMYLDRRAAAIELGTFVPPTPEED